MADNDEGQDLGGSPSTPSPTMTATRALRERAVQAITEVSLLDDAQGHNPIDDVIVANYLDLALNSDDDAVRRQATKDLSDLRALTTKADLRAGKAMVGNIQNNVLIADAATFRSLMAGVAQLGLTRTVTPEGGTS